MTYLNSSPMYALLVGIDNYANPRVPELGGCVPDVNAMELLLQDRFNVPPENIKKLTDNQATHQAIKDTFVDHLISRANAWAAAGKPEPPPGFLFHYSGHGSQALDETGTERVPMDGCVSREEMDALIAWDCVRRGFPVLIDREEPFASSCHVPEEGHNLVYYACAVNADCPVDVDYNGEVNDRDVNLVQLNYEWGCDLPGWGCTADTNGDHRVDQLDIVNVLNARHGPCPN